MDAVLPLVVIVAPFATFAALFRRRPWLCLAIVAAPVGCFLAFSTDAFGGQADRLGVYAAVGFGGGALVGGLIGGLVGLAIPGQPPDAGDVATAPAVLAGIAGMIAGGLAPAIASGEPPDMTMQAMLGVGIGGGLGWAAGALVGRTRATEATRPSAIQQVLLVVAAGWVLLFAASVTVSLQGGARGFGPPMDGLRRAERRLIPATTFVTVVDGAVVVATLLSATTRGRNPAAPARVL